MSSLPQQPYLLRALYEWCVDCGYTPYIAVRVDPRCRVPMAFVREGQIVLNIGPNAVRNLQMDNEWVSFSARFGGVAHDILIPVLNVQAIYARETGEGMVFPPVTSVGEEAGGGKTSETASRTHDDLAGSGPDKPKGKPRLRVVK